MEIRWIMRDGEKVLQFSWEERDDHGRTITWHDVPVEEFGHVRMVRIGKIPFTGPVTGLGMGGK